MKLTDLTEAQARARFMMDLLDDATGWPVVVVAVGRQLNEEGHACDGRSRVIHAGDYVSDNEGLMVDGALVMEEGVFANWLELALSTIENKTNSDYSWGQEPCSFSVTSTGWLSENEEVEAHKLQELLRSRIEQADLERETPVVSHPSARPPRL